MTDAHDSREARSQEVEELKSELEELRSKENASSEEARTLRAEAAFASSLLAHTPHPVVVVNPDGTVEYVNAAFERVTGFTADEVLGIGFPRPWWDKEYEDATQRAIDEMLERKPTRAEAPIRTKSGARRWMDVATTPFGEAEGEQYILINWTDITERKRAEETARRQSDEILELSTPVMQVWDGVLVAPLIGTLDSSRAEQLTERILESIAASQAKTILVDITGVPMIDTRTAQHLIDTITAARLLGTAVVLTGVRPPIAQTLVHLGIDLSNVTTRSSLASGLKHALGRR